MKRIFLLLALFSTAFANDRSPSRPYISGDTFRAYADFIYDEIESLDPAKVKDKNTIFVETNFLDKFFQKIHPKIDCKYILITHNSDLHIPGPFLSFLEDDKIIAWFGQNPEISHSKLHGIPIGMENKCYKRGDPKVFDRCIPLAKDHSKKHLLIMNFQIVTYVSEREKVYQIFSHKPFCYLAPKKNFENYLLELAEAKFVLSPRGNGLDCLRTWEALLMGTIPIVKTSSLDSLYKDLPVLIIQNWEDVTKEFLETEYKEMTQKYYNPKKLFVNYWFDLIDQYKNSDI